MLYIFISGGYDMNMNKIIDNVNIPKYWKKVLFQSKYEKLSGGKSGMITYKLDYQEDNISYVLKLSDDFVGINELKYEVKVMEELSDIDFVPNVYLSLFNNELGFSIREYIDGVPIDESNLDIEEIVSVCGKILKDIHNIEVSFDDIKTHQNRLIEAEYNVNNNRVDEADFEEEYQNYSAKELYTKFLESNCEIKMNTFTHGDFNFPNIIYSKNGIKVIDWGRASISDSYQDISLLIRELNEYKSITKYDELVKKFQKSYELQCIDETKKNYFILMDEFF